MTNTDVKEKRLIALKQYRDKVKSGEIESPVTKNLKEKWEGDKKSLRKSINYMCIQCFSGEDYEGGNEIKKEISRCSSKNCALWNVRPYK